MGTFDDDAEATGTLTMFGPQTVDTVTGLEEGHASRSGSRLRTGEHLASYTLERRLGAGGMGEVYAARREGSEEQVALKIMSRMTATNLYRFKREFRALADVAHPNLVRLFELALVDDEAFFTMELIDGAPFVRWVRKGTPAGELPDLERLEHGLRELITGVHHLHCNDYVHRDLKPSNVLVTPEGRVVILDFGLVSELGEGERGVTYDGQMVGTPAYMAPEQARGEPAGVPADFYAIGVMLFECLTGRLPYEGSAVQQLISKQDPIERAGDLEVAPAELRDLCLRLLARDPAERPRGLELGSRFHAPLAALRGRSELFVGRSAELALLREAFDRVRDSRAAVVVHLRGPSGNGKSALCGRFRSSLGEEAIVFHGRCRERESVPYKGLDAVVDALSAHLRQLSVREREELRPRSAAALARVFPVLDELWTNRGVLLLEPSELRGVSWAALREVLDKLAEHTRVVIHIDDLQWADADSVSLLQALIRPPRSPAALVLLTSRDDLGETEALRALTDDERLGGAQLITHELGPLPEEDARELARLMARERGEEVPGARRLDASWAESVALRSRGVPFFIEQLVYRDRDSSSGSSPDLDEIVTRRVVNLPRSARALLELVAVSGGPLAQDLALALCPEARIADIEALEQERLLISSRGSGAGGEERRIETTHERIREVVITELEPGEAARLHLEIGEQLLATSPRPLSAEDLFAIVDHLDAAFETQGELQDTDERRLELAELNRQAGELAFESAAWVPARRYFHVGHELIEPWLAEARRGEGPHRELCLAVVFGRARAEDMGETGAADAVYADLQGWSLAPADFGRVTVEQLRTLGSRGRFVECVDRGVAALGQLGVAMPREPNVARALAMFWRGWRAVAKLDLAALEAIPDASDEHARAVMGIAAATAGAALAIEPKVAIALLGLHARMFVRHGYHGRCGVGLVLISIVASTLGSFEDPVRLCDAVLDLIAKRPDSAAARSECWARATVGLRPRTHSLRALLEEVDAEHRYASETGKRRSAEWIANIGTMLHLDGGTPLPRVAALIDEFHARSTSVDTTEPIRNTEMNRRFIRILVEGPEAVAEPELDEPGLGDVSEVSRHVLITRKLQFAVLFGAYERAWSAAESIASTFQRKLGGMWLAPMYAMLSVITMVQLWPEAGAGERRKMRRMMRKHRRFIRARAAECAENYGAMAELVEGELARLEGRVDEAGSAYERASSMAKEQGMLWLAGLAYARLARLDQGRGRELATRAAREAAREAYTAWGAVGLVRAIERTGGQGVEAAPGS